MGEFEDRRSRFIAQLVHVSWRPRQTPSSRRCARAIMTPDNVPAWVLADGRERCSDDGEQTARPACLRSRCCTVPASGRVLRGDPLLWAGRSSDLVACPCLYGGHAGSCRSCPCFGQRCRDDTGDARGVIPYSAHDRLTRMVADAGGRVQTPYLPRDVQLTALSTRGRGAFVTAVTDFATSPTAWRATWKSRSLSSSMHRSAPGHVAEGRYKINRVQSAVRLAQNLRPSSLR